jgi:hypothetical protein
VNYFSVVVEFFLKTTQQLQLLKFNNNKNCF